MALAGQIWDELETAGHRVERKDGWFLRRIYPDADSDVFMALRHPGSVPALLVEVDAAAVGIVDGYPSARGFELYPESVTPGPGGRTRLCLLLADTRYRDVFEVLVNDVSDTIARTPGESESVNSFLARLRIWQNFMKKHGVEGLTKEAQVGLFGELSFLANHLIDRLPVHDSVNVWKGADRRVPRFRHPATLCRSQDYDSYSSCLSEYR